MEQNIEYIPTNREKTMQASKDKYWCYYCDGALVGDIGKCPNCGKINNVKKKEKYLIQRGFPMWKLFL